MRPEGKTQRKLIPFKVLVNILYGESEHIKWVAPTSVELRLGPLARRLGIPNYRLRDYLRWLHECGFISNLDLQYGKASLNVHIPPHLIGKYEQEIIKE